MGGDLRMSTRQARAVPHSASQVACSYTQTYCASHLLSLLKVRDVHLIPHFLSTAILNAFVTSKNNPCDTNLLLLQLETTEGIHHPRFTPGYYLCINSARCFSSQLLKARSGFVSPITITERALSDVRARLLLYRFSIRE